MSTVENRGPHVAAVAIAFFGISFGSVVLRIFTRLRLVKWLGADDILILLAEAGAISQTVGTKVATRYGLGKHIDQQKPEWAKPYQQYMLTASMSYSIAAMFVKLSLLAFYLRLSPNRTFRLLTYIMIAISVVFGVGSVVAVGFQCIPLKMLWDATAKGSCFDVVTFYFANAGIHILTETGIYILPIHTLWKLHLPTRQKLGLCGLMGLGAMLIVISCYRIATLQDLLNSPDISWNVVTPLMWYSIEVNLAIFIACGPAFLAFFRHYLPAVFGGSSSRSKPSRTSRRTSYPLGSIAHVSNAHENKNGMNGTKTTVSTANQGSRTWYGEENSSEEMIIGMGNGKGGIQKQVDVWVENEDGDVGKAETRSNNSVGQDRVAETV